ncbi:MAG: cytochrome c oxidase assembly protein [Methylococcales bacterium]|nr:cytochrome c oxidase assembly protein [Methylococcales bacterium]MDD5630495.1 cytochrome c oxidase assembly protein [Methylococcales bacterium]
MNPLQWLVPWEFSFAVLMVTAVAAMLFIRGSLKCKLLFRQKLCFWTGLLSLYVVSHTQIDYYSEHEFFVHQLQSLVLHHLGPFLIVLSCPKEALSAGLPVAGRRLIRMVSGWKPLQCLVKVLFHPAAAVTVFVGLIAFWLLPPIHFIAMLDWRIYRLMNWSMVLNGLMFWGIVLDSHSKWSPGSRIVMMLAVIPPQILIGALIFFTPHELYPIYTLCGRAFTGMSSITDQQIGGLILWMNAAMMSVIGILIVIHKELQSPESILKSALAAKKSLD